MIPMFVDEVVVSPKHRVSISKVQPTRCNVFSIYLFL